MVCTKDCNDSRPAAKLSESIHQLSPLFKLATNWSLMHMCDACETHVSHSNTEKPCNNSSLKKSPSAWYNMCNFSHWVTGAGQIWRPVNGSNKIIKIKQYQIMLQTIPGATLRSPSPPSLLESGATRGCLWDLWWELLIDSKSSLCFDHNTSILDNPHRHRAPLHGVRDWRQPHHRKHYGVHNANRHGIHHGWKRESECCWFLSINIKL